MRSRVEVVPQQVRLDYQSLSVVVNFLEVNDVLSVGVAVGLDQSQQLDLVQRLVEEVLVVGEHLEAADLALHFVFNPQHPREHSVAQESLHLPPPHQHLSWRPVLVPFLFFLDAFPRAHHLYVQTVENGAVVLQGIQRLVRLRELDRGSKLALWPSRNRRRRGTALDRRLGVAVLFSEFGAAPHELVFVELVLVVAHVIVVSILVLPRLPLAHLS